jgi:tetratricopeptide (TPR) repeat protein
MLESGQTLSDRFVLNRRLGGGGSGEVWLAQDRAQARRVALKVLHPHWSAHPEALAALEREYAVLSGLDHPHLLRVEGLYRAEGLVWIAMELAEGGDLSRWRGRSASEIVPLVAPIAAALRHLHAHGIVHRDVKPSNILLTADGRPKLADCDASSRIGATSAPRGSPFSMSPQQLAGAPPDPSDDVYALGATLYELLSGYPPFYPDARPERVRTEQPAALPASVPAPLAELIEHMLAKTPAERPAMDKVERDLQTRPPPGNPPRSDAAPMRIEPPSARAPGAGEPLRSEWRKPSGTQPANPRALERGGFRRGLAVATIALGLVAVLVVFFVLPRWVEQRLPNSAEVASSPTAMPVSETSEQKQDIDYAALARAKQRAEDLRETIATRLSGLRDRAVDRWGGADITQLDAQLAQGDAAMQAREYEDALARFAAVVPLLDALEARASEVLKEQLAAGVAALDAGRSADARAAFELAAQIDPNNAAAAAGLKRASTLDEVLEIVAAAERLEKEEQLQAALEQYRKALALDAQAPRAAQAVSRIEARLAGDAFAAAMARGFSALARADHANARRAFEEAGRLRPNAPEVAQALRQVEQEQRTNAIATKLRAAQTLEAQERWADALKEYRSVLELDQTVAAAKEGIARVEPRAQLNEQLEMYLTQPERLFSQPVRAAARETLARAQTIANPGPVLQQQIATLADWLARADVPVQVQLQSDNQTQVTIYRVGSLGTFETRSVELVPGSYTVVGTRPGYRDVRRQIDVRPGVPLEPIVIRCEERI